MTFEQLRQEADARQAEAAGGEPAEVHAVQDHREGRRATGNKRIGKQSLNGGGERHWMPKLTRL